MHKNVQSLFKISCLNFILKVHNTYEYHVCKMFKGVALFYKYAYYYP